jgi:hypothetical protein
MAEREEESFKVTDRRRRVDEEDAPSPAAESERRAPEPAPRAAEPAATAAPPTGRPPGEIDQPQRDLTGLFLMFASSALVAMGEAPHPQDGSVEKDLDAAAEAIDMLMLLREKTEGRLTAEEEQLLGHILYDLQLRFVEARKTLRS